MYIYIYIYIYISEVENNGKIGAWGMGTQEHSNSGVYWKSLRYINTTAAVTKGLNFKTFDN